MSRPYGRGFSLGGPLGTMVRLLIAWNVIFFLIQEITRRFMPGLSDLIIFSLGLSPFAVLHGQIWRLATYMFLHGSFFHILLNMLALWMFGSELEYLWGPKRFLEYYFFTGIGAGITNTILQPHAFGPIIGASGAIFGLLLAYGIYFPHRQILLYFLFPIPARIFVLIFGAFEFFEAFTRPGDNIAHLAHLGGLLFGFIYLKLLPRGWFRFWDRPRRRKNVFDIRDYRDPEDRDRRWR